MTLDKRGLLIIGGVVAFVALMIFIFVGALPGRNVGQGPQNVTLTMWGVADSPGDLEEILKSYRETFTADVRYQQFSEDEYENKLLDALASGKGPDIYAIKNTWLPRYLDKLVPVPVEQFSLRDLESNFVEVIKADMVSEQKIYGLPWYADTLALIYNRNIFNSEGVATPPKTWDNFAQVSQQLTRQEGILGAINRAGAALGRADNIDHFNDIISLLLMQAGEKMNDSLTRGTSFDRAGGPQVLDFYVSFAKPGNVNQSWDGSLPSSLEAFATGRAAMILGYATDLSYITARSPQLTYSVAPIPQPTGATTKISYAGYWAWAVSNRSNNSQLAWQLIAYVARSENLLTDYLIKSHRGPALRSLIPNFQTDPVLGVFAEQNLTAKTWYQRDETAVSRILANMINSVLGGSADSHRALREASQQVDVILQR